MNTVLRNSISILALGLAGSLTTAAAMSQEPAQASQLGQHDAALESLRAGAVNDSGLVLVPTEREVLLSAAAAAPFLESLRATGLDLSDHELQIVLVTAAVVVLLVVLL